MTTMKTFPTDPAGLSTVRAPQTYVLRDDDELDLRIAPVTKQIGDAVIRMLAYDGSIPGPTLRVRQGSELAVNVVNDGDLEATVHWHGLRLENRFDGTSETQRPMEIGGSFTYRLTFASPSDSMSAVSIVSTDPS
jgi:FtsP/CotA-like multicopper oxidase with cupredoxin domain